MPYSRNEYIPKPLAAKSRGREEEKQEEAVAASPIKEEKTELASEAKAKKATPRKTKNAPKEEVKGGEEAEEK